MLATLARPTKAAQIPNSLLHKDMRIGTCPVGYADGLKRTASHQVLVRGKRVNVVGRVCMDSILVDLDAVPEARVGDEVVLVGSQGAAQILVSDVAARWGTIDCDVTCGITARVPRIYTLERFGCEKIVTSTL
jgi:alanine racemase